MKELIRGRWVVEGYYRYDYRTSLWRFLCEYCKGYVIWEFDDYKLECFKNGLSFFEVPFTVAREDILLINYSDITPVYKVYIESHNIVLRDDALWLYDRGTRTHAGEFWLALKLTRE